MPLSKIFLAFPFVGLVGYLFLFLGLPDRDYPVLYVLYGVSSVVALLLVPVGMVGFHVLQRHSYGREAHFGFWLVVVGSLVVLLGGVVFFTLGKAGDFLQATPPLVWVALGLLGLVVGLVSMVVEFALYGVATLQAKVLPRWCGVAFIAALPVALALSVSLHFSSMFLVFGLAWLALGHALWALPFAPTVQQPWRVR
jgi:hypothetical protein